MVTVVDGTRAGWKFVRARWQKRQMEKKFRSIPAATPVP